jgi:hypothetical protein
MFGLQPPRHTSTLPNSAVPARAAGCRRFGWIDAETAAVKIVAYDSLWQASTPL